MNKPHKVEYRSACGELRATDEEGVIEGYVAVWNTVDSYNSTFQRGCFLKTIQERGLRVKVLWNHEDTVIGKPLELREDDHGLWVRLKLVLAVPKAREVYELIRAGAVDTFSFGFNVVKDKYSEGRRIITEVRLMEVSPVIFEANSAAVITGVRQMSNEKRAEQYQATYAAYELGRRGDLIMSALYRTLEDIWWGESQGDETRQLVEAALTEFVGMYTEYTIDLISHRERDKRGDAVTLAARAMLAEKKMTPEQFAASTSFTLDEVRSLLTGNPAVDPAKHKDLPEDLRTALAASRAAKVEALCMELRGGLAPAEVARIRGLLPEPEPTPLAEVSRALAQFRAELAAQS